MKWTILAEILYALVVVLVCLRIIWDTRRPSKALAYLLLVIFLPLAGIFVYFSFGINYRKRKMFSKKILGDDALADNLQQHIVQYSRVTAKEHAAAVAPAESLAWLLARDSLSALTAGNDVKLLINGEEKFPEVFAAVAEAKHHIHIEYYIFEDDDTGQQLIHALTEKSNEGVTVRFIYDDFGSHALKKKTLQHMKAAGIRVFPFSKIRFIALANRLNYRNHRKIIVIDGCTAFVGGINVSERYVNTDANPQRLFWRDTHLRIDGAGAYYVQYLFLCDWNFCAKDHLQACPEFFPDPAQLQQKGNAIVQIAASGPDSDRPTILFAILQAIKLAKQEILITTPYFIPGESILDALMSASLSGVQVKILVPGKSDSRVVNAAAWSNYGDLLRAGAAIYLYRKGFVHAKTLVTDNSVAMVGTANMDYRSFDLNFEVNAIVYGEQAAKALREVFYRDLQDAEKIDPAAWRNRPVMKQLGEKCARLISPML
ncbi:cardiolipin synthase [Flavihumibacter petaseus]|uniref:Cardiolipin synthase n=1 Tax=Flavihumibacter petaseus NBRC 106054 TaxID=1220578 RepID=A0A0E9N214_9BACT|nr:cardiolipin synthase [Flavihumibacter petaseus]GAO44057.1 cardiolipin synthetase [Flavihumibacter petaseus NBRC 106054]